MPVERSAGIIFFRPVRGQPRRRVGAADARAHRTSSEVRNTSRVRKYLIIRSSYHGKDDTHMFWDFPKGLLDKGEDGLTAAKREAKEEVGIEHYNLIPEFKYTARYFIRGRSHREKSTIKFVALFLAEAKEECVTLSWEHDHYEWLPYNDARERLSRKEVKEALDKAEEFLEDL